ncbi:dTDP-4-dehydrorhamnose 3,5-epimerase [Pacificispira sp.]|uniref:dTDP-4-dehydrorhamnose 3,5-epimerase n=1 Tax=Pacificispira sp. TaxID=2888761 RepID=UPI003BAB47D4
MKVTRFSSLDGPLVIDHPSFGDHRGRFDIPWNADAFAEIGFQDPFLQDNIVRSSRRVLRGLHYQNPEMQGKLLCVLNGAILDVAVDLRADSPTLGRWVSVELSAQTPQCFWVPRGFAHGYQALSDDTIVFYKVDGAYAPQQEVCIRWDDSDIGIDWPLADPIISDKDLNGVSFAAAPRCHMAS